jgi:hypothetical protein
MEPPMNQTELPLSTLFVVRCFFGCGHTVGGTDPLANHAAMERHYETAHPVATCPKRRALRERLAGLATTARVNGGFERSRR